MQKPFTYLFPALFIGGVFSICVYVILPHSYVSSQNVSDYSIETSSSAIPEKNTEKNIPPRQEVKKNLVAATVFTQKQLSIQSNVETNGTVTNPTTTPSDKKIDFEDINIASRPDIVNILCTTKYDGVLSPITATGVVIDPKGTILTNAHVGQYLLLKDYPVKDYIECSIRTGSPAYPRYKAELVYISSTWVENNKKLLTEENPLSTGENDFAILRITSAIDGSILPSSFSYIPLTTREIFEVGEPTLLISYPAGFLGGMSILRDLNLSSAITNIREVFTFKTNTIDLISIPNTIISQKGASGGAVIDKNAKLIGIISTSSDGKTTSDRDLRAITIGHINRTLGDEINTTLDELLKGDISSFASTFQSITAPLLAKIIENELKK